MVAQALSGRERIRAIASAVFAGDRRVWRWAAIAGVPLLVLIVVWSAVPRSYYTGTDSVNQLTLGPTFAVGQRVCVTGLELPAGTRRVELAIVAGTSTAPRLRATVKTAAGVARSAATGGRPGQVRRVDFTAPRLPQGQASVPARICLRSRSGTFTVEAIPIGGTNGVLHVAGAATGLSAAVWYRPSAGARRSYLAELGTMADRAAVFAPAFARPWLFVAIFVFVLPLAALLAIRTLALAAAGSSTRRRLALWLFAIAVLNGCAWSVITPAFQAPDEVDHFAYAQSLVERGQKPTPYAGVPQARWSTAETAALIASDFTTDHTLADTRAPGLAANIRDYQQLSHHGTASADNGGGNETTASYGPLYYYAVAPGYLITRGDSVFTQLGAVRIVSALIGALAGVFAFLAMLELLPEQPWLAALAGLVLVFEPMYSFESGALNNDIGIDAGAAAVAYLLIRMVKRGLPPRLWLALGVLLGGLPYVKSSAYELYPITIVAIVLSLWRNRRAVMALRPGRIPWRDVASWLAGVVSLLVVYVLVKALNSGVTPGPPSTGAATVAATSSSSAATGSISNILHNFGAFVTYLWEIFLPRLSFMTEHFPPGNPARVIFLYGGWASFGWDDIFLPAWVYDVILVAMAVAVLLGLRALWIRRSTIGRWWPSVVLVVLFPIVVLIGFESAFFTVSSRAVIAEMGRYAFPALVPLAVLGVGALLGLGRRIRIPATAGVLVAFIALCYASQALTFTHWFS